MALTPADTTAVQLFDRSVATLVRSWVHFATGSRGAEVIEAGGTAIAAFPSPPQRDYLNNTLLGRGLTDLEATLDLVQNAYAERGIERYAVWVHESEGAAARAVAARGLGYDSSTRSMAMPVDDLAEVDTSWLDLAEPSLAGLHRTHCLPDDFLPRLPADAMRIFVARFDGANASALMAIDHEGDCGIYNVGTVATARRRGLATALAAHAVVEAGRRGCTTASLQATEMAEGLYARLGFRDLGRFDEYVPAPPPPLDEES